MKQQLMTFQLGNRPIRRQKRLEWGKDAEPENETCEKPHINSLGI